MNAIPIIKDVIIEPIAAKDSDMAKIYGLTINQVATYRREMAWFPSYARGLLNGGKLAKIKDFGDYLAYRKSYEWSQEKRKNKK